MPRPVTYPNVFGTLSGTVSASLLDQNFNADGAIINDSAAGWVNVGVDTGSVNSYIVTLTPPPSAYLNGFFLSFVPLNTNSGPSSINVNGLGNIQILTPNGSSLNAQMLQTGTMYTMVCVNGAFRVISPGLTANVGEIQMFAGTSNVIPVNWQLCNGQAISRVTYAALFAVIGTLYGSGDGSTSFNVPNLLGRFPMHNAPGTGGGAASVALSVANLPAHNHGINDPGHVHGVNDPGHFHSILSTNSATAASGINVFAVASSQPQTVTGNSVTNISIQGAGTGISTQNTGSGSGFAIIPPFLTFNFIIRCF